MTFEQWFKHEYPKMAKGQTTYYDALRAAFDAGGREGWASEPRHWRPSTPPTLCAGVVVQDGGIPIPGDK